MTDSQPHIVILGAGPAGLGAAYKLRLDERAQVTIVDRNSFVGGNAASFEVGDQRVDLGSHRLHPSCDTEILKDIRSLLGNDLLQRPRHGRIRLRGKWIHFPPKPIDLMLKLDRSFAFGAIRDMLVGGSSQDFEQESFASVLQSQLGTTICDQFYLPYAKKIWGLDPHQLSPVQAQRRVSAGTFSKLLRKVFGKLPGVKPVGYDYYFYPRRGFGQISDAIAQAATSSGAKLVLAEPVVRIEAPQDQGDQWSVTTEGDNGQRSLHADMVWSTIPISLLARLITPSAPADVLAATESVKYRAMIVVYLQLPVDRFTEFDAHYFPDSDLSITRLSEPKNYSMVSEPRLSTVLCAELPCSPSDSIWNLSTEEIGQVVLQDLKNTGLPVNQTPDHIEVRRLAQAYPIYDLGYEVPLQRLETWLADQSGLLTFGRQGLFVHDNTHHALYMAYCAARCLTNGTWDTEKWSVYRKKFETHVVED